MNDCVWIKRQDRKASVEAEGSEPTRHRRKGGNRLRLDETEKTRYRELKGPRDSRRAGTEVRDVFSSTCDSRNADARRRENSQKWPLNPSARREPENVNAADKPTTIVNSEA
ncbi:hypothetical protein NDU88_004803 [Pleurodeles waltl]|uniref:Uncharacterized protein n=1 Tax=Pleurodeles waltl TaxID=8319 RepID=A0AAV7NPM3_PLEWA|nr:hypothetical protein NDU88_004803 [Pleurodeles waltl]